MEYTIIEVLEFFLVYSFFGWCVEVIYHAVTAGHFINRGFDIGPVCPIYGFGALSVLLFLEPLKDSWGILFIASVAFTTLIEFVSGFLLERFFYEKWWDYSNEPFNIKGYICPRFSLFWGLACVMVVYVIHPTVSGALSLLPETLSVILLSVCYAAFVSDVAVTVINVMHIRSDLRAINDIEKSLERLSVSIGTNLSDSTLAVMDKTERLKEDIEKKQEEVREAVETAQWDISDAILKMQSQRELLDERRRAELDEMTDRLARRTKLLIRRTRRISRAFPNLTRGRYSHIFNDIHNKLNSDR